jgi:hypothetical protein
VPQRDAPTAAATTRALATASRRFKADTAQEDGRAGSLPQPARLL